MVKEGIVMGHKISSVGIDVDKAKVDVIAKLPYPISIKGIRSFLGHAGFYHRFIKDFSKISRPMTQLLMKDTKFVFYDDCIQAFNILKKKLTTSLVIIAPDWNLDFELMCDASDYAKGAVIPPADKWSNIKYQPSNKRILERTLNGNKKEWADKLDDALWAFKIAYKSPIGSTPFRIVYGKAYHLTIEMEHKAYWALKNVNLDLDAAGRNRTKRWHDAKITNKEFQEGEEVLVFNSRLKLFPGKLRTRWLFD
ncbi:reverse transcriptase domain-containing protein [Tanacetum coccineum]